MNAAGQTGSHGRQLGARRILFYSAARQTDMDGRIYAADSLYALHHLAFTFIAAEPSFLSSSSPWVLT